MTQNTYINLIRQYAALAKRFNKSYAPAVNAIVQTRLTTIEDSGLPNDEFARQYANTTETAKREYGSVDRDFVLDIVPF